jgi:hypothetical protein
MITAGYSGTPLWKKLGYEDGMEAFVIDPPAGYLSLLVLPPETRVTWLKARAKDMVFVHLFSSSEAGLKASLVSLRKAIAPSGVIWVSWPKKSSDVTTDITEDVIRAVALAIGLVDIKVCAVDSIWSGLKLMIRKELR